MKKCDEVMYFVVLYVSEMIEENTYRKLSIYRIINEISSEIDDNKQRIRSQIGSRKSHITAEQ
jgi:hypothetical protein